MKTTAVIDATKARNEFFQLLNDVFEHDSVIEIKKSGITVGYLSKHPPAAPTPQKTLIDYAGVWKELMSDEEADELLEYIDTGRKLGSRNRKEIRY